MTRLLAWVKENRELFYGCLAFLLVYFRGPWSIVGAVIIGHIAAKAYNWREYGAIND